MCRHWTNGRASPRCACSRAGPRSVEPGERAAGDHERRMTSSDLSRGEQQLLEPDEERLGDAPDAPHGEQHAGHEGLAADGVVAYRERLPDVAEYDLPV